MAIVATKSSVMKMGSWENSVLSNAYLHSLGGWEPLHRWFSAWWTMNCAHAEEGGSFSHCLCWKT